MKTHRIFDFMEIIHVELSDKRGKVCCLEVFGEDFEKAICVGDDKRVTRFAPVDSLRAIFCLISEPQSYSK